MKYKLSAEIFWLGWLKNSCRQFFCRKIVYNLVQRILSNRHIDLSDFSSAALSSIAVATATPHSFALHMRKSSYVNIAET